MAAPAPKRSVARGDVHYRRQTVTGTPPPPPAPPTIQVEGKDEPTSATTPPSAGGSGDKRNFLSKLNILRRSSATGDRPPSRELRPVSRGNDATSPTKTSFSPPKSTEDDVAVIESPSLPLTGDETATDAQNHALKQGSIRRKRTGSLRKTALLGGRRNATEVRERREIVVPQLQSERHGEQQQHSAQTERNEVLSLEPIRQDRWYLEQTQTPRREEVVSRPLRREFSYESVSAASSSDSGWSEPAAVSAARLSLLTEHSSQASSRATGSILTTELGSPLDMKSPTSQASFVSTTTDDDDSSLNFPLLHAPKPPPAPISTSTNSYFPSLESLNPSSISLPRKSKTRRSPLSRTLTLQSPPALEAQPHDYTETETWGWILLVATWLTFTVGMGSCLEIWSWAWDVGDTPKAPPELEDDPTLPIVGYYPALMVLTGVVAWGWITVAWVGMKYFRHAKIEV